MSHVFESYPTRDAVLGEGLKIRRALPVRQHRTIGSWCFLDHFGPKSFDGKIMDVGTHPHIGLQTVTWLLEGEVLHRDSLGYEQVIRPGQLNIMTAGKGISHSEETPPEHSGRIHGIQFWIALPDAVRHMEPDFAHHPEVPVIEQPGLHAGLLVGECLGERSPALVHSPMVGMDVTLQPGEYALPLKTTFEHGVLVLEGSLQMGEYSLKPGALHYLGMGRDTLAIKTEEPSRFILVGGEPFGEEIFMWWNFVARTPEEIRNARELWVRGEGFGSVPGYPGKPLAAPDF